MTFFFADALNVSRLRCDLAAIALDTYLLPGSAVCRVSPPRAAISIPDGGTAAGDNYCNDGVWDPFADPERRKFEKAREGI